MPPAVSRRLHQNEVRTVGGNDRRPELRRVETQPAARPLRLERSIFHVDLKGGPKNIICVAPVFFWTETGIGMQLGLPNSVRAERQDR